MLPTPPRSEGGRGRRLLAGVAILATAVLAAGPARAHETEYEVQRGKAVALRAWLEDGPPLAGAAWQVYAPGDERVPRLEGRTDRNGWLAFVPDAPGPWRVHVVDGTGHGLDVVVEGGPSAASRPGPSASTLLLRPLLGVAAVGALFGALLLLARRRRNPAA